MSNSFKLSTMLVASVLTPWLLATTATPSAADELYKPTAIIQLPDGQILDSFDISTLDPRSHFYALSDRTNSSVDIIDTEFNVVVKQLHSKFAGHVIATGKASGPNGVIIVEHKEVWAADGPVLDCKKLPCKVVTPSSVKVIDIDTGDTKKVVSTGGQRRADELCFNPRSDWVLVANDAPQDNYLTFIKEDTYETKKLKLDGTDPNATDPNTGNPINANGIEQCVFNPRDGKFYLSLPDIGGGKKGVGGSTGNDGAVVRISSHAPFHVEAVFPIAAATGCLGPQGTVIGPAHQIGLGCGGTNSLIIDDRNGSTIKIVTGQGGTDEAWYDPGSNHYFFGQSGAGVVGVEDAGPPPKADPTAITAAGSKNPAVDPHRNQVYVPVLAGAGKICSSNLDVFGNKGDDTKGCIAIYTAPSDKDDCLPEGEAVIAVNEEGDAEHRKVRCERD